MNATIIMYVQLCVCLYFITNMTDLCADISSDKNYPEKHVLVLCYLRVVFELIPIFLCNILICFLISTPVHFTNQNL